MHSSLARRLTVGGGHAGARADGLRQGRGLTGEKATLTGAETTLTTGKMTLTGKYPTLTDE